MEEAVRKRIYHLKVAIRLLEEHLEKHEDSIRSEPYNFIKNQIIQYRRELDIRKLHRIEFFKDFLIM